MMNGKRPHVPDSPAFDTLRRTVGDVHACKALIARALPHTDGTHTLDDVCLSIVGGRLKLWVMPDAMLLTEFVDYPRKRFLNYFLAAGDLDQILDIQPDLTAFARANGCAAISCAGRPGWARITSRQLGWQSQMRYCVLTLDPEEGHHEQRLEATIDDHRAAGASGDDQAELRKG